MVIRFPNGQSTAIDFREKAPLAAHPEMWLDDHQEYSSEIHHRSYRSVGVPGTVAGFDKAHRLFGHLDWGDLVRPAVELAENGFELSEGLAGSIGRFVEGRGSNHEATVAALSNEGKPYEPGDTWKQRDLAGTLTRIMRDRRDGFYKGETARLIVAEMRSGGGLITEEYLDLYQARERATVQGTYRGYHIISMPAPSSGGAAIVTMLNILEGYDLTSFGHNRAAYIHHLAEAMRRAYRDRAEYLADSDFADVPVQRLTSKEHADWLRRSIDPERASVSHPSDVAMARESPRRRTTPSSTPTAWPFRSRTRSNPATAPESSYRWGLPAETTRWATSTPVRESLMRAVSSARSRTSLVRSSACSRR